jgi:hypothetical protein
MHAVTPQIRSGEQEVGGQLVFDGQSPSLNILIPAALPLQSARVIGGVRKSREIGSSLFEGGAERGCVDRRAKRVALEPGVEVVILGRTAINAEAGANNSSAMKGGGGPSEADPRIKISVICAI